MSFRWPLRGWLAATLVAASGCNLNPQGEDPGFEDGPGYKDSADDGVLDDLLPSPGEGQSRPPTPDPVDLVPNGEEDVGQGPITDNSGSEPPQSSAPEPVVPPEAPPIDEPDDAVVSVADAGAVDISGPGDGGVTDDRDGGAPPIDGGEPEVDGSAGDAGEILADEPDGGITGTLGTDG